MIIWKEACNPNSVIFSNLCDRFESLHELWSCTRWCSRTPIKHLPLSLVHTSYKIEQPSNWKSFLCRAKVWIWRPIKCSIPYYTGSQSRTAWLRRAKKQTQLCLLIHHLHKDYWQVFIITLYHFYPELALYMIPHAMDFWEIMANSVVSKYRLYSVLLPEMRVEFFDSLEYWCKAKKPSIAYHNKTSNASNLSYLHILLWRVTHDLRVWSALKGSFLVLSFS